MQTVNAPLSTSSMNWKIMAIYCETVKAGKFKRISWTFFGKNQLTPVKFLFIFMISYNLFLVHTNTRWYKYCVPPSNSYPRDSTVVCVAHYRVSFLLKFRLDIYFWQADQPQVLWKRHCSHCLKCPMLNAGMQEWRKLASCAMLGVLLYTA